MSQVPILAWQIDSTSQHVTMRLYAEGTSDGSFEPIEHGLQLAPEQARQIIRDLSAAVLAMDLKLLARKDDANARDNSYSTNVSPTAVVTTA